ncbi:MAG: hypothetical protein FJ299_04370 [Planctomycetes bacterium]|nr:hypothetical protein [Planctomycetota bacterium]
MTFPWQAPQRLLSFLRGIALAGAALFVTGLYYDPEHVWIGFLVGFTLFTGLAVTGPFFLSLLALSGARWPGPMRRIPEAMVSALPLGLPLGIVLMSGLRALYDWSDAAAVANDELLAHKSAYLNPVGFGVRMAVYFALWTWLGHRLVAALRAQDSDPSVPASRRSIRAAAAFLSVFAITFSLASVDWLQSLEPHWFSTIYALVVLSTVSLAGLSVCTIVGLAFARKPGCEGLASADRVEDLGRLFIGLSLFWAYIGFCQYMLIWYTNMPEETSWYVTRSRGEWPIVARACTVLCWLVPFLALMPKRLRRDPKIVARVAVAVLGGAILHLYYLVAPAHSRVGAGGGLLEVCLPLAALAGFLWMLLRALAKGPREPVAGH